VRGRKLRLCRWLRSHESAAIEVYPHPRARSRSTQMPVSGSLSKSSLERKGINLTRGCCIIVQDCWVHLEEYPPASDPPPPLATSRVSYYPGTRLAPVTAYIVYVTTESPPVNSLDGTK
jgi:hypothetical protein